MKMKYVIFDDHDFIIMSQGMDHSRAKAIGKPISAGFCSISKDKISCYGESISLGLKSNRDDPFILNLGLKIED